MQVTQHEDAPLIQLTEQKALLEHYAEIHA